MSHQQIILQLLKAIQETMKESQSTWVSWWIVTRRVQIDPVLLSALCEQLPLSQYIRQNKTLHKVSLTRKGHLALQAGIEGVD